MRDFTSLGPCGYCEQALTCSSLAGVTLDGTVLGRGTFGIVLLGRRPDGELVAVKRSSIRGTFNDVRLEAKLLAALEHKHVLRLYTAFEDTSPRPPHMYMVLELCHGPDLQRLLDARGAFTEAEARHLMTQLLDALCYLRSKFVLHRDVKPANCLLRHALHDLYADPLTGSTLKLADFGFAKHLDASQHGSRHGSKAFAHFSEALRSVRFSPKTTARGSRSRDASPTTPRSVPLAQCSGAPASSAPSTSEQRAVPPLVLRATAESAPPSRHDTPSAARSSRLDAAPSSNPSQTGRLPTVEVTPKGTRFWHHPRLRSATGKADGLSPSGRLSMTRDEAFELDLFPLGHLLRYMLSARCMLSNLEADHGA